MEQYLEGQYIIVKFNRKYRVYDNLRAGIIDRDTIKIMKDNKVYLEHSYEVLDDYALDTGPITHWEKDKVYLGKLVYQTNDLIQLATKYMELEEKK